MKKTYRFLLTAGALLSLVPIIAADGDGQTTLQKGPDYYLNSDGSIGFSKSISEPNTDGVYYITLESFATGESTIIRESKAADIVLVLDMSGSMAWDMAGNTTSVVANRRVTAMKNAVKAFIEQIDINDKYEKYVAEGSSENIPREQVLGNRIAIVTYNSSYNNEIGLTPVATGKSTLISRVNGLSDNPEGGTRSDLGMEQAYNILRPLGNDRQIRTTIMFTDGDPGGGAQWDNSTSTSAATESVNIGREWQGYYGSDRYGQWNYTQATVLTGYQNNAIGYNTGTRNGEFTWQTANKAISFANDIKNLADEDKKIISNVYSVSIIPDASTYTDVYLGMLSSNYKDATQMAELVEVTEVTAWQGGNSSPRQGGRPTPTATRIRHSVSWDSSNPWGNGNGTALPAAQQKYVFEATDAEKLKEIFETIASESGGGSEDLGEESITEVDVVSASFMMPEGTSTSDIEIYIAECYGVQEPKQYIDEDDGSTKTGTFLAFRDTRGPINIFSDPKVLSGYTYTKVTKNDDGTETIQENTPVDANISISFGKSGSDPNDPDKEDIINVNGFDYGGNWCGPRKNAQGQITGYHGYKVIVKIPVKMDPNAVGGADSPTNAEGSGIIVKGNNVAPFRSPKVSLPINIHIRKEGLDEGESAKFTIERKLKGTNDPWIEISSVFVTRQKGQDETGVNAPITKIVGMPSVDEDDNEFIYRVVESDWSWAHNLTGIKGPDGRGIGDLTTRSATSDELITNPFIFVNTKKDGIDYKVRHAESKATNVFKAEIVDNNVKYDDSKKNTGVGRDDEEESDE